MDHPVSPVPSGERGTDTVVSAPQSDGEGAVASKSGDAEKTTKVSPILIAVWTAAVAALGNGVVSWMNGRQMYALEHEKAQSAVILEVVKTNSPDKAAGNLAFLVEIGVISEEQAGERLKNYLKTRVAGQGPSLSSANDKSTGDLSADATCGPTVGDYVVVGVHLGDSDGGLNIRLGPNQTSIGVIPATGTGIDVGTCMNGWCQVRYKCLSGWAFANYLALRKTRLARVKDSVDPGGLVVLRDPGPKGVQTGTLAVGTTDVVKHVRQEAPLTDHEQWCQISSGTITGWVPLANLEEHKTLPAAQAAPVADHAATKSVDATPSPPPGEVAR